MSNTKVQYLHLFIVVFFLSESYSKNHIFGFPIIWQEPEVYLLILISKMTLLIPNFDVKSIEKKGD